MGETYRSDGVAHEIISSKNNGGPFHWIDVRCGARLPPQMGPANIGDSNDPVTCLACLCTTTDDLEFDEVETRMSMSEGRD
jgi:hypothetical protein